MRGEPMSERLGLGGLKENPDVPALGASAPHDEVRQVELVQHSADRPTHGQGNRIRPALRMAGTLHVDIEADPRAPPIRLTAIGSVPDLSISAPLAVLLRREQARLDLTGEVLADDVTPIGVVLELGRRVIF